MASVLCGDTIRILKRALFLDRDGVINEDMGYVHRIEDFRFIEGIFEFCAAAVRAGYLIVVITNQAGIAKGYYSVRQFRKLTLWMTEQFRTRGIPLRVYYCPYHPEAVVDRFRRTSSDRKPSPGMILRAARELDIDLARSVLVGDKESDLEAGRRAGVGTILPFHGDTFPDHGLFTQDVG